MIVLPSPTPLVCSGAVTVLGGLIRSDGVALVADRAAVYDGQFIAPGVPAPAPEQTKVFAVPTDLAGGLIGGFAGKVSSPTFDLREAIPDAVASASSVLGGAERVLELLDRVAGDFRAHAGIMPAPSSVLGDPVISVVLLAGRRGQDFMMVALGLPLTGEPRLVQPRGDVVFAPRSVQPDAELMLMALDPSALVEDAAQELASNVRRLAPLAIAREQVDVSASCDIAVVSVAGNSRLRRLTPPAVQQRTEWLGPRDWR